MNAADTKAEPLADPSPVVLVGAAPSTASGVGWDPASSASRKLAEMVGCDPRHLGVFFGLENLLHRWPSASPPDRDELREAASFFRFVEGFRFLLVGSEVTRAFGRRVLPMVSDSHAYAWSTGSGALILRWVRARCGADVAMMHSPSAKNHRLSNMHGRQQLTARFLRDARWLGDGRADDIWRSGKVEPERHPPIV